MSGGPQGGLRRGLLCSDPMEQLRIWLQDARRAGVTHPSSMVLCTVDAEGHPTARSIPLRHLDQTGLVIFTNLDSTKATQMRQRPDSVTALFDWPQVLRQVRVDARARVLDEAVTEAYFAARPRQSQLNAWASRQSQIVDNRAALEELLAEADRRFPPTAPIPRPPTWGVIQLEPRLVEFWQAAVDQIHDRFRYRDTGEHRWTIERMAP